MPRIDFLSDLLRPHRRTQDSRETKPLTLRAKRSFISIITPRPRHVLLPEKCIDKEEPCHTLVNRAPQDRKRPPPLEWKLYEASSMYTLSGLTEETLIPASPDLTRSSSSSLSYNSSGPSTPSPSSTAQGFHPPPSSHLRHAISSYFARELDTFSQKSFSRSHDLGDDSCESSEHSLVTLEEAGLASLRRRRSIRGSRYERNSAKASRRTSLASLMESKETSAPLGAQGFVSGEADAETDTLPDPFACNGVSLLEPRKAVAGDVYDLTLYTDPPRSWRGLVYEHWVLDMRNRASTDHRPTLSSQSKESIFNSPSTPTKKAGAHAQLEGSRPRARTMSAPSSPRDARIRYTKSLPPIPDEAFEFQPRAVDGVPAQGQGRPTPGHVQTRRVRVERSLSRRIDELMTLIEVY
ncbi:hypothetical protein PENSPDRAFT_747710 [Peniophora sp. CONT]|nr:hypothetical protein PENSPDRAFT_747710 [Peniophora sp. CONT]